ncbi:MAG: hypothetical protein MUC92_13860 [Fimbriimonadaceae bacterium]|jgi:hypothetical protein|nr:hypothetical protein [Fimbriimonadaceae bacterium]
MKGFAFFVVIAGIFTGIFFSLRPWHEFNTQRLKREQAKAEMRKIEQARSELIERSSRLATPLGMEEEARRRGYLRQGETKIEL